MRYFLLILILYSCNSDRQTAEPIVVNDTISKGSLNLRDSLSASIEELDSLKPVIKKTIAKLKEYEILKKNYENQAAVVMYKPVTDSSQIMALRSKLKDANNEISRLNGELAYMTKARNVKPKDAYMEYVQPAIETPDENAVVITLDGSSRKGEMFIPDNLVIHLIPYSRKIKSLMTYDSSCEDLAGNKIASYYKGVYFFNDIEPGKYLIKICTYFGNYKLIEKNRGKLSITMQVSPPLQ